MKSSRISLLCCSISSLDYQWAQSLFPKVSFSSLNVAIKCLFPVLHFYDVCYIVQNTLKTCVMQDPNTTHSSIN